MSTRSRFACAVGLVAAFGAAILHADVVGEGLTIIAQDNQGNQAVWSAPLTWDGQRWIYDGSEQVELRDPTTDVVVGWINPVADPDAETSVTYVQDPVINLNFSVQAGGNPTTFHIASALLTFPTIANAQGAASAAISVTDSLGDGATLTGIGATGGAYLAQYNGFAGANPPAGTTFAELHPLITVAPFGTATASADVPMGGGFAPIAAPVSDMSALVSFELTPFDLASGTSVYTIIPEPASLALVVLCGGLVVGHRRR